MHITTVPVSLNFFKGQIGFMKAKGFEVHALSSPGPELGAFAARESVPVHAVDMPRRITPLNDLVALARLYRRLRSVRPHIVHAHTPKGGLLGMLGAWVARTPVRVYHIHGLPLTTATGYKRVLLSSSEKIACRLAHRVFCVSASIRDVAVAKRLCPASKIDVLANGSINGVDTATQFNVARKDDDLKRRVRAEYGIPADALVIGFVGRIVRDKGLIELVRSWQVLRERFETSHLLVVGAFEPQDPIPAETAAALSEDPRIHLTGRVEDTSKAYAVMDVLALPSYREGFGLVAAEAAAMEVPVVATSVPGCIDAVQHSVTGTLVPAYDAKALSEAIARYLGDPELRRSHGQAGRLRVERDFRPEALWNALYTEYIHLLREKRLISDTGAVKHGYVVPRTVGYRRRVGRAIKVAADFATALVGLVVLSPLLAIVALLVRIRFGSPIVFKQERPGLNGAPFYIYKFRTMSDERDAQGELLPDEERLSALGRFLRSSSLDELPELFNVLRGEMSLVGPRPLRMEYLDRYTSEQARRHEVKPGITGWAQVNGRNALAWDDRFAFDVWYVDNWSLWLDIKICFLTVFKVLKQEGISADGYATMPEFLGSERD